MQYILRNSVYTEEELLNKIDKEHELVFKFRITDEIQIRKLLSEKWICYYDWNLDNFITNYNIF